VSFALAAPEGGTTAHAPAGTPIWLDCSRSKQQALNGGFEDLRAGRRVEVGYADAGRAAPQRCSLSRMMRIILGA
jgi:hypothetical protein